MSIIQTNTFICERCGIIFSLSTSQILYEDSVIVPPEGWDYNEDNDIICDKCMSAKFAS